MGGDHATISNIKGTSDFLNHSNNNKIHFFLIGDKNIIKKYIHFYEKHYNYISIIDAPEVIDNKDKSLRIFKTKPNSSLVKSIQLLKDGKVDAVISAGSTARLLSTSLFILGKIKGIKRPALAPYIPTESGGFILCDAGANIDTKPFHLLQFAIMSQAYLEHFKKIKNAKVGLLNIGSEENKGNELSIATFNLLNNKIDNFEGNIESRYIFDGLVDIIICDGFVGNILLKSIEGITEHLFSSLRKSIKSNLLSKLISPFIYPALKKIKNNLDYEEYGGTTLLGIDGIVIKAHGSSTSKGIKNSILNAENAYNEKLIEDISIRMQNYIVVY